MSIVSPTKNILSIICTFSLVTIVALALASCSDNASDREVVDTSAKISISPSSTYQEMVGFGGALTWYCDRITSNPKKNEIMDLIVNDLGVDIVRLKNWYYPKDYPGSKSTIEMEVNWFKPHFDATNEFYNLIKTRNADTKILFSSWGPPSALKSNGKLQEGTLKKESNTFVYSAFATYWEDILNNITFSPDYLSIQNEPNFVNPGWETCEWAATETSSLPGYVTALDSVYKRIKDRQNLPTLLGPESANLSTASFKTFADAIKNKTYLGGYAYHPYNLTESSAASEITTNMKVVGAYTDKPNFMTEYSGMSWFNTARMIHSALMNANASAYIYWELMWDENNNNAMIKVDGTGNYTLTPFYYLVKHYAKNINVGYQRIHVSSAETSVIAVAFKNTTGNIVTAILLNANTSSTKEVKVETDAGNISNLSAWQSTESTLYKELTGLSAEKAISLPPKSITTIIIEL